MDIFDTHTHLDFSDFDADRSAVLDAFAQCGGRRVLIAGVSMAHSARMLSVADEVLKLDSPVRLSLSLGLHPMFDHGNVDEALSSLSSAVESNRSRLVAVGEFGLDKHGKMPLEAQQYLVGEQLALANRFELPVVLHCRGYHNELLEQLDRTPPKHGGVLHAFSGSMQLGQSYIKRGLSLGIGGVISYPRAAKTRKAVAQLPLENMVIETDSPDMPLEGRQGKRNEPQYIVRVIETLAELKSKHPGEVAHILFQNSESIFK